jgi:hypothetical protein
VKNKIQRKFKNLAVGLPLLKLPLRLFMHSGDRITIDDCANGSDRPILATPSEFAFGVDIGRCKSQATHRTPFRTRKCATKLKSVTKPDGLYMGDSIHHVREGRRMNKRSHDGPTLLKHMASPDRRNRRKRATREHLVARGLKGSEDGEDSEASDPLSMESGL